MKFFIQEWKKYGFKVAWYNVKFNWAFKHLNAKSMKITQKSWLQPSKKEVQEAKHWLFS